ncbi:MAG: proline--tRNA ligase [Pseudomonadales bacterium]|nr:proline--tRNA ligase [Pseudomonadales bacterium]
MLSSQLLIPTLKETPADAETPSHRLMLRAGLIRKVASGLYTWLPLGLMVLRNIETIIREEMEKANAQELLMPVVQPKELWQESGRWEQMGLEMLRMQDRHQRDFCMGPTHEEVITDLFRNEIHSYKQLPCNLYQIQTKFRDEIRPRYGVMRAREFTMKDAYSFDLDQTAFDRTFTGMHAAYTRILERTGVHFRAVEADSGKIGGAKSYEFHVLADSGEDKIAFSDTSDYAANIEKAEAIPPAPSENTNQSITEEKQRVATPNQKSIDSVCKFLKIQKHTALKTLIVESETGLVALVLRGDHELNEIKAQNIAGVSNPLTFADETRINAELGCPVGSLGPVGLEIPIIADHSAAATDNFTCGANENDFHFTGINWNRDVRAFECADLRNVVDGDPSPDGYGRLQLKRGIEVGHIFQLGTLYSAAMKATIQDKEGKALTPIMGCYGMGVTRLVAAVIEQSHDDSGIIWPLSIAPFKVHLLALNYHKSEQVRTAANDIYTACQKAGIKVLLDDRGERPGIKFADADLIGIPLRVTVGDRALADGNIEFQSRREKDKQILPLDSIVTLLKQACSS